MILDELFEEAIVENGSVMDVLLPSKPLREHLPGGHDQKKHGRKGAGEDDIFLTPKNADKAAIASAQWKSWTKERDFYNSIEKANRERWEKTRKGFVRGAKSRITRKKKKYQTLRNQLNDKMDEFEAIDKERWALVDSRKQLMDKNPDNLSTVVQNLVRKDIDRRLAELQNKLDPLAVELDELNTEISGIFGGLSIQQAFHSAVKQTRENRANLTFIESDLYSVEGDIPLDDSRRKKLKVVERWLSGKLHKDAASKNFDGESAQNVTIGQKPSDMKQRAHAMPGEIALSSRSTEAVIVHELGHVLEFTRPQAARGFLTTRVGDEQPQQLKKLYPETEYEENEWGAKDDFTKAFIESETTNESHQKYAERRAFYTGKHYSSGWTEVTSMGLEQMYRAPLQFAENDPEYFRFMLGVIDGTWRRESS